VLLAGGAAAGLAAVAAFTAGAFVGAVAGRLRAGRAVGASAGGTALAGRSAAAPQTQDQKALSEPIDLQSFTNNKFAARVSVSRKIGALRNHLRLETVVPHR